MKAQPYWQTAVGLDPSFLRGQWPLENAWTSCRSFPVAWRVVVLHWWRLSSYQPGKLEAINTRTHTLSLDCDWTWLQCVRVEKKGGVVALKPNSALCCPPTPLKEKTPPFKLFRLFPLQKNKRNFIPAAACLKNDRWSIHSQQQQQHSTARISHCIVHCTSCRDWRKLNVKV